MRPLLVIVVLAACPSRKPPANPASVDSSSEQTETSGSVTTPTDTTTPNQDAGATAAAPLPAPVPSAQAVAHCLYVGPEHRVVRCYWKREECDGQLAFNTEMGMDKAQQCRSVAEVHCMQASGSGESCYPTAGDCDHMVANMRKRNRQASDCSAKTRP